MDSKIHFIISVLVGGIIFAVVVQGIPRALDHWYQTQYEKPMEYIDGSGTYVKRP